MKLSDLSDQEWFDRLNRRRGNQAPDIRAWWDYHDGRQPLYYVARILSEQDDRFPPLLINWCRKYVRSIDGRSILEGFGYVGEHSIDDAMQAIMLRNELDVKHSINNVSTLVTSASYIMVGPSSEGARITVESPESMAVEIDPVTGRAVAALKVWSSDVDTSAEDRAVLLLPGKQGARVVEYEYGRAVGETVQKWMAAPAKLQSSPEIPVVPFVNAERWGRGTSQLADLRPIVDAANQTATNMLAAIEHHAVPRKAALGIREDMFMNDDGTVNRAALKQAYGALWVIPFDEENTEAPLPKIEQFTASDLRNFHETLSLLARIGSGLTDLTPSDFGFGVSDNPPSAESINAAKHERLLGIERFNRQQGAGYERVMRLSLAVEGVDASGRLIESKFRNPATPTKQSMADAAVKTLQTGIADLYQARVDYGYSDSQIKAMEARERELARDVFLPPANQPELNANDSLAVGAAPSL